MTRIERNSLTSRVFTLANRLSSEMGRSAAFVRAWQIVRAGAVDMPVRGTSFGSRQEALRRLAGYDPKMVYAVLVPEHDNPADPAAVAVMVAVQGGRGFYRLGYVPREQTAIARALRNSRPVVRVLIGNINGARICLAA